MGAAIAACEPHWPAALLLLQADGAALFKKRVKYRLWHVESNTYFFGSCRNMPSETQWRTLLVPIHDFDGIAKELPCTTFSKGGHKDTQLCLLYTSDAADDTPC
eukprot:2153748-Amphidinium_carterae.1